MPRSAFHVATGIGADKSGSTLKRTIESLASSPFTGNCDQIARMAVVDFARNVRVTASPPEIWKVLTDVHRVVGWIGVVGSITEIAPLAQYTATLTDRVGPFRLSADLDVKVLDVDPDARISFVAQGEDRHVASRILVEASLAIDRDDEQSEITVAGSYVVTGRVATLGASMIRSKGDKILDEFIERVREVFA